MIHIIAFLTSYLGFLIGSFLPNSARFGLLAVALFSLVSSIKYLYEKHKIQIQKEAEEALNVDWRKTNYIIGKYDIHVEGYCPFLKEYSLIYFDSDNETKMGYCPTSLLQYISKEKEYKIYYTKHNIIVNIEVANINEKNAN